MAGRRRTACVFCLNPATSCASKFAYGNHRVGLQKAVKKKRDKRKGEESCKLLENEMIVVFIVRKLLSISSNECEKLLEMYGNPSSWVEICETCSRVVDEAMEVSRKICVLERELEKFRENMKKKIASSDMEANRTESYLVSGRKSKRRKVMVEEINEAVVKIRSFLNKDESVSFTTLENGNNVIKEELQEIEPEDINDEDYYPDADVLDFPEIEEDIDINEEDDERISQEVNNCNEDDKLLEAKGNKKKPNGDVYNCSYCSSNFKSEVGLAEHLKKIHWVYRKGYVRLGLKYPTFWKCRYCQTRLKTFNEFKQHCIDEHSMFSCGKCPRLLKTHRSLYRHHETLHNSILPKDTSRVAKKNTDDNNAPRVKTFTVENKEIHQCIHCNYCNKLKSYVRRHMFEMHGDIYQQVNQKDPTKPISIKCDKCPPTEENISGSSFSTIDVLNNHKVSAHGMIRCTQCVGIFLSLGYLENHQLMMHSSKNSDPSCWIRKNVNVNAQLLDKSAIKLPQCKFCREIFNTNEQLTKHNLKEHKSEMFKCETCLELFDRLSRLYSHKTNVHKESNNPYKCTQCDFTHKLHSQVYLHYINIHEKRPRVVCELCSASFAREKYLEYHKANKHGQGDPGKVNTTCKHCNKVFSTPAYLTVHITTAHLGQWRYKCSYCDIGFVSQKQVDHHVNAVHTKVRPHKCPEEGCNKAFAGAWQIKQHWKSAHGPRTFKCSYCDYVARANRNLKSHEKIHTEVGPYTCDICGKTYTQLKCLQQHLRLTHKVINPKGKKAKLTPFVASITNEKNNHTSPDIVSVGTSTNAFVSENAEKGLVQDIRDSS